MRPQCRAPQQLQLLGAGLTYLNPWLTHYALPKFNSEVTPEKWWFTLSRWGSLQNKRMRVKPNHLRNYWGKVSLALKLILEVPFNQETSTKKNWACSSFRLQNTERMSCFTPAFVKRTLGSYGVIWLELRLPSEQETNGVRVWDWATAQNHWSILTNYTKIYTPASWHRNCGCSRADST